MPQCPTNQENFDNPLTLTPMHKYDSTINDIYTISRELNYLKAIIHFYAPEIEVQGAYCFCPVRHSVLLSETLNLVITFEQ